MKTLLVSAQDIRAIAFALVEDGRCVRETEETVPPEQYLAALDRTLKVWDISAKDIASVAVVVGPGAFTSSRVSTVMANAFAFAGNIPVIAVENAEKRSFADVAASLPSASADYAVPVYNRPPNITFKK